MTARGKWGFSFLPEDEGASGILPEVLSAFFGFCRHDAGSTLQFKPESANSTVHPDDKSFLSMLNHIRNFLRIDDRLATSGMPRPDDFAAMHQAGFEVVINLAMPTSDRLWRTGSGSS